VGVLLPIGLGAHEVVVEHQPVEIAQRVVEPGTACPRLWQRRQPAALVVGLTLGPEHGLGRGRAAPDDGQRQDRRGPPQVGTFDARAHVSPPCRKTRTASTSTPGIACPARARLAAAVADSRFSNCNVSAMESVTGGSGTSSGRYIS